MHAFTSLTVAAVAFGAAVALPGATAVPAAARQQPAAQQQQEVDLYYLTAIRAAPGRARELMKFAAQPAGANTGRFAAAFVHREGGPWDVLVVQHRGKQATIDVSAPPPSPPPGTPAFAETVAWHEDLYATGPPLAEFKQALGLGGQVPAQAVFVIGEYRAPAGHRPQLLQSLQRIASQSPGRGVVLQHVDGAPWTFVTISRYDSIKAFAEDQAGQPPTGGMSEQGLELREHMAEHRDTLASVMAVNQGTQP